MGKRGQVTVYIIIGIVLLLGITGYVYLKNELVIRDFFLPNEMKPIVKFSEACVEKVSLEGVKLAGIQGGYIKLPNRIEDNPDAYIDLGFKVPYWYYKGEDRFPSKKLMELQIGEYIDENLNKCIRNYEDFSNSFNFQDIEYSTKVDIGKLDVKTRTDVNGAVIQQATGNQFTFPDLQSKLDYNLGELHSLAIDIIEKENEEQFMEVVTHDLIAASDQIPTEGIEITCKPRQWTKIEVENHIKDLLTHNLPQIRFDSLDQPKTGRPYFDNLYTFDLDDSYKATAHVFYNADWDINLQVTPNQGNVIKPFESRVSKVTFNCFKLYHHLYTLDYPVIFQLSSKQKNDLLFYFGSPVMVTKNQPNRQNTIALSPDEISINNQDQFCEIEDEVLVTEVLPSGEIASRTETVNTRTNSLRIRAVDVTLQSPNNYISDVNVSYQCVSSRCSIGQTEYPLNQDGMFTGGSPILETQFPDCSNGFLILEKEGYHNTMLQKTVSDETDGDLVNINMIPLKELNVNVLINDGEFRSLSRDEGVAIILRNQEVDFETQIAYPLEDSETTQLLGIPATYNVQLILTEGDVIKGVQEFNWSTNNIYSANRVVFFAPILPRLSGETDEEYFLRLSQNENQNIILPELR